MFIPGNHFAYFTIVLSVSCIDTVVTNHFEMLFRNMANKLFHKFGNGNRFINKLVVLVSVVMKGYKVTVILIDSGGSDDRTTEITTDIFDNLVVITFVWFGINVEAVRVVSVACGFESFEGLTETVFQKVQKNSLKSVTKKGVVEMSFFPKSS